MALHSGGLGLALEEVGVEQIPAVVSAFGGDDRLFALPVEDALGIDVIGKVLMRLEAKKSASRLAGDFLGIGIAAPDRGQLPEGALGLGEPRRPALQVALPPPGSARDNVAFSGLFDFHEFVLIGQFELSILGQGRDVFDLSKEKNELRDRYGRHTFGQDCLAARRMVEAGVPYITINYPGGWDTHSNHFATMRRQCPQLDQGLAMLLQDLQDHNLLESTIVWCCGEFGRSPKVDWQPPWNGGRNHYGNVFSVLVAGGGFKGGHVVGESDQRAEEVKTRPVYPVDLLGSIYALSGIDSQATLPHPMGLEAHVLPSASEGVKSGGLLTEIM